MQVGKRPDKILETTARGSLPKHVETHDYFAMAIACRVCGEALPAKGTSASDLCAKCRRRAAAFCSRCGERLERPARTARLCPSCNLDDLEADEYEVTVAETRERVAEERFWRESQTVDEGEFSMTVRSADEQWLEEMGEHWEEDD